MESIMESSYTATLKSSLLALSIGLWLYWLWTRRNLYRFSFQMPAYFGAPILGVFVRIKSMKNVFPALASMLEEIKRHTFCVWMGFYPVLFTVEPEVIEQILSSNELLNKSKVLYEPLNNFFEGGIVSSHVDSWHRNRKLINPSFSNKVLLSFLPVFHKGKNLVVSKLEPLVGKGEQKFSQLFQLITLGISVETTMGKILKDGEQVDEDLAEEYFFMMETLSTKILFSFLNLGGAFNFYRRYLKTKKYLHNFVEELIVRKLKSPIEGTKDSRDSSDHNNNITTQKAESAPEDVLVIKKNSNIFIDQAIQLYQKQQFSWNDIIAESNTIVATSFESTANTVFSALVMLAMHPEVQEKLYEEIVGVFPEKDFRMEHEHVAHLPYLERIVSETLRLAPAVPIIGRQVTMDTQLDKGLMLPKDLQIIISIFHLHRRTDIWGPNANKFDPDNFLPENMSGKHAYAYIPFSKGSRNCIGWRYAKLAMKVLITGLVRNYRFTTTYRYEDLRYVENIAIKFLEDPGIEIHRR